MKWLKKMEKAFANMECIDQENICFVAYQLQEEVFEGENPLSDGGKIIGQLLEAPSIKSLWICTSLRASNFKRKVNAQG